MTKQKLSVYFIFIAALTLFTTLFLISYNSYLKLIKPSRELRTNSLLAPINPKIDIEVVEKLENKHEFTEDQILIATPTAVINTSARSSASSLHP